MRASPADRASVLRLHLALYDALSRSLVPEETWLLGAYEDVPGILREDVDALFARDTARILLAKQGRAVIGYITCLLKHEPRRVLKRRASIEDWYVVPELRGRGIGAALMNAMLELLRAERCQMVESATPAANQGSRRAHAKHGFEETEVRMRRRLT